MGGGLQIWVLYENPSDYPGEWVVRRQVSRASEIRLDRELAARGATREACETALFERHPEVRRLAWLPRHSTDDSVIVGTWM